MVPSHRAIENLMAAYAELLDTGNFAGVADLLGAATFTGSTGPVRGRRAIERMFRDTVITYADGTPRTKHLITNIAIKVNEVAGTAIGSAYFTVLQALPDLPLQPIASGRYHDHFECQQGEWRFTARFVRLDLLGDVSRHLRKRRLSSAGSARPDSTATPPAG